MSGARAAAVERLRAQFTDLPGLVVAFSGGVDSAVLTHAAAAALDGRVLAVLADSASLPRAERDAAVALAAELGVPLELLATAELDDPRYRANRGDRCFWCKEALFRAAGEFAVARGWPLAYGENADDLAEERAGARSAAARGVLAPLRAAGWGKEEVRAYARRHGLTVAEKPAAPCLASRLPVGVTVGAEVLGRVERLEAALHLRGYPVVRARHYSAAAVVLEFPAATLERALEEEAVLRRLARAHGYPECTLRRYRSGAVAGAVGLRV